MNCGFCDSHCHPSDKQFQEDLQDVIQNAKNHGLEHIIGNACGYEDAINLLMIAKQIPEIHPCIGIHPWYIHKESMEKIKELIQENQSQIVGIGEIGLDFAKHILEEESNTKEKQIDVFQQQIELAKQLNLPISVHSRYAGHYAIEILIQSQAQKVQLHAFDGGKKAIQQAIKAGYYFSIGTKIFQDQQTINLVKLVPMDLLLLETDSPDMSLNEKRNDFSTCLKIAERIAEIKNCTINEVIEQTTKNCKLLYRI